MTDDVITEARALLAVYRQDTLKAEGRYVLDVCERVFTHCAAQEAQIAALETQVATLRLLRSIEQKPQRKESE